MRSLTHGSVLSPDTRLCTYRTWGEFSTNPHGRVSLDTQVCVVDGCRIPQKLITLF